MVFSEIVFTPAPLSITYESDPAYFRQGTDIHGISWAPEYSELIVTFHNFSSHSFDDFDMTIGTDMAIAKIVQDTSIGGVSIVPEGSQIDIHMLGGSAGGPPKEEVLPSIPGVGTRYRVVCNRLPSKTSLMIVAAVMDPKKLSGLNPSPDNQKKLLPEWASVEGSYRVLWRIHSILAREKVTGPPHY